VTGLDYDAADAVLKRARWNVKAAIIMQRADLTLPQALKRLKKAHDSVSEAIGEDAGARLKEVLTARPESGGRSQEEGDRRKESE
jgi:hypothetical protein